MSKQKPIGRIERYNEVIGEIKLNKKQHFLALLASIRCLGNHI